MLDEVHFLQDAYRGPVWEEVIIHLPTHVRLVCLSATCQQRRRAGGVDRDRARRRPRRSSRNVARCSSTTSTRHRPDQRPPAAAADDRRRPPQPRRGCASTRAPCVVAGAATTSASAGAAGEAVRRPAGSRPSNGSPSEQLLPAIYFIFSRNAVRRGRQGLPRRRAAPHRPATSATRIREIVDRRLDGSRRRRPRRARLRPFLAS